MNGLLVRVGADLSAGGGSWNGPVDSLSHEFAYVAIPENSLVHRGMEKPYAVLAPTLAKFGVNLPSQLRTRHMHLDPDFHWLTYGDQGERAKQLKANLCAGDLIVFYAGLADIRATSGLVYAVIGLMVVDSFRLAADVPLRDRDGNAHSRRVLAEGAQDIVVAGRPDASGRLRRCLPIGEYRDRAYRVRRDLLDEWGGLSVKDGYLQRSARLPRFLNAPRFLRWFAMQRPSLTQSNN
jgi:putative DNA base modification enzyme with NMAD domain